MSLIILCVQEIEKGDPEGTFASWLESLPASSDEKKTILNTIRYNNSSTALHLAAEFNQPAIAKLLLDVGAGRYSSKLVSSRAIYCWYY
jgi:ankyrin repeat protein